MFSRESTRQVNQPLLAAVSAARPWFFDVFCLKPFLPTGWLSLAAAKKDARKRRACRGKQRHFNETVKIVVRILYIPRWVNVALSVIWLKQVLESQPMTWKLLAP